MSIFHADVEDRHVKRLRALTGIASNAGMLREALSLLLWAAEERAARRIVIACNEDGRDAARLVMASVEHAAAGRPPAST
jgi:hypothetical protein